MQRLKAAGKVIKEHRLLVVFVFAVFSIGMIAGVNAIQEGAAFPGQSAEGDHNFWDTADYTDAAFCANCHNGIFTDMATGPHGESGNFTDCVDCHDPEDGTGHVASPALCTDCHSTGWTPLAGDAHEGIAASLGESIADWELAKTCQSCHTHREVIVSVTPDPPLELNVGG
jgi:hypothetical protein